MVYTLLTVCVITHIVDIVNHTDFIARLHIRVMAITVILIWLRLMKNARAFSALGKLHYFIFAAEPSYKHVHPKNI